MLSMISHIIGIDQNIIKIDYHINIKKVRKNVIHKVLENSRSISKIKEHDRPFKGSIVGV